MYYCFLLENSYLQSPVDNCVYSKHVGSGSLATLIWVDDIIIRASNMLLMSEAKGMLKEWFHMKGLGRLSYFLGIHFEQGDGFVKMNQKGYITKVLQRFEMSNCSQGLHLQNRSLSLMVKPLWILDDTLKQ